MSTSRIVALTSLTMVAFASNSLLCRLALSRTTVDAASFTTIRLVSGALVLWLIARTRASSSAGRGSWTSALALFAYAAGFSLAYRSLPASTGALLLFGAVQATMIGYGLWKGERFHGRQLVGLALALGGLVGLLMPGLSAPPLAGSLLMLGAGAAWGVYSLRGRSLGDPIRVTAGNFLRAAPLAVAFNLVLIREASVDFDGFCAAFVSGALASGIGYSIWYTTLPALKATVAAAVQLSVPALAAFGGIVFLREPLSWRLLAASAAILGGIALVIDQKRRGAPNPVLGRTDDPPGSAGLDGTASPPTAARP